MSKTPKAPKWRVDVIYQDAGREWHWVLRPATGLHAQFMGGPFAKKSEARRVARLICAALNGPKPTTKPRKERTK